MDLKCVHCIEEYLKRTENEKLYPGEYHHSWNEVRDADTLVPSWQMQSVMGQMAMACVALPVCVHHIQKREPSTEEVASRNGLLIPTPRM